MRTMDHNQGFSTLELLIAFAIMTLSMTAVIMVAFGSQATAIDTELAQRALYHSQHNLENAGAALKSNFDATLAAVSEAPFVGEIEVTHISECAKRVDSRSFWDRDLRELTNTLSMIFTDATTSKALGHDCATEEPEDEWDNPDTLVSEAIGGAGATSIDEYEHRIYLTSNPGNANNKAELYIYDFDEDTSDLIALGSLDLGKDGNGANAQKFGLLDIDVVDDYAFVASASTTAQLQVIDVSNPAASALKWAVGLPGVDPEGSYPAAQTVYYFDERVYVGTAETDGPEFHIFDVSGDLSTTAPVFLGSLELTHNVNDIVVRGSYAYLATSDNNHELMVIDISNPGSLTHPDVSDLGFNASGNNDGTAIYITGDRVYLGRVQNNPKQDEFYILSSQQVRDDTSITDGLLGSERLNLSNNAKITGIRVGGTLAFLSIDDPNVGLAIYNIVDPANIFLPASCSEVNIPENNTGIDNDARNKYLFITNKSNDEIRIMYDQIPACS